MEFLAGCAGLFPENPKAGETFDAIIGIAKTAVFILQILVPIGLIIWGTIDLGKAVIEGDEKKMKEKRKPFIQRVISAVLVFLVPWLVGIIIGMVGGKEWKQCWNQADKTGSTINDIGNNGDPINVPE